MEYILATVNLDSSSMNPRMDDLNETCKYILTNCSSSETVIITKLLLLYIYIKYLPRKGKE